ncbi:TPR-repeat protein, specific for cyanobacteria [Crocosphaera watsonii WH 8502]|uniref:TPR repeat n=7 Tax=Aphanothecaceae TaxID=1890450 RepID=Q4C690_CROWT|nr:TPR repeat [Crocosphaera watsonii WH 8501]EHJ13624.1 TPR-repeat protein, specific for cyanobacteria [Crocosphaera watsonii WH 0003]CCQ53114.1 TPR-repeat protein, specific for cyanobacteria [Crocosphaera watsonii WH 8502]CCQ55253.1 TPR-repeat protein, specific for cyanobacteria [Crocosphaera watsonii WH 0005]CCQ59853.1 TPR-repeat protein, specific for cyanobacteria [Crocosphaera watsonii WH 0401]
MSHSVLISSLKMTETVENAFEQGLERYKEGESIDTLIPYFKEICDRSPKNPTAWACLAWLYLLADKPESALKAARKSVKIDSRPPQARINLALAMLDTGAKGVRDHIEAAQQLISLDEDIRNDIMENIEDGLSRKPGWKSLERVKKWLVSPE